MGTAAQALGVMVPAGVTEFDADLDLLAILIFHGALTQDEAMEEREALSLRMNAYFADQMNAYFADQMNADGGECDLVLRFSSGHCGTDEEAAAEPFFCELPLAA
ncbi:hypothetical protein CCAX7_55170 [Capsulimonas corticalis]|uniref:Uncharacterized protein n=1 Tax=Capsulimonas corticalis TaxID=2219043 RepID=A0A402D5R4_9BACT|nr:hypothetical protein [Capsulimonas corticalis]BDI33466.1 hypothetical protein CCAX7_55170 [Capsulimonas corticalis]